MYPYIKVLGNQIFYTEYRNGKKEFFIDKNFKPSVYVKVKSPNQFRAFPEPDIPLTKYEFESIRAYKDQIKFLPEHTVYGNIANLIEIQKIREMHVPDVDTSLLRIFMYDIETYSINGFPNPNSPDDPITVISIADMKNKIIFILTTADTFEKKNEYGYEQKVAFYYDETLLLKDFAAFIHHEKPDVLSGWNSDFFDLPYIYNRMKRLCPDFIPYLSPFNIVLDKEVTQNTTKINSCEIIGIQTFDYLEVYKTYARSQKESYKLNDICEDEIGKGKIDYSEEGDLNELWLNNKQKYIEYNIRDVLLLVELDDKTGYMELIFALSHFMKASPAWFYSNTKMWLARFYNILLDDGYVFKNMSRKADEIIGAFVKEPPKGLLKNLSLHDVISLYPTIAMQFNLSWETYVGTMSMNIIDDIVNERFNFDKYRNQKMTMMPMGSMFSIEKQGYAGKELLTLFKNRKLHNAESKRLKKEAEKEQDPVRKSELLKQSKKMYNLQYAEKIALNSFYGALTFQNFPLYNREMAESITSMGQVVIKTVQRKMNEFLNSTLKTTDIDYVAYCDTDSTFICLDAFVDKIRDKNPTSEQTLSYVLKICEKMIQPKIDEILSDFSKYVPCYAPLLKMNNEMVLDSAFWVAKKRYAASVCWDEGIIKNPPSMKIMGMQIVRSDTPKYIRAKLKNTVRMILDGKDIVDYIHSVEDEFNSTSIEDISFPKGVSNVDKYYDKDMLYSKGTPIHVRAALLHNNLCEKLNLLKKYQKLRNGDKIRFVYLKMPNELGENVIGFKDVWPVEFSQHGLEVDREEMFKKIFMKPLEDITENLGIKIDDTIELW